MKINLKFIAPLLVVSLTIGCSDQAGNDDEWTKIVREKKTVDNITYYFSSETEVSRRNAAILESQTSIKENLELIGETEFTNEMDIEFVASREEMLKFTGMGAQGMAFPDRDTFFTLLKDEGSPIKHEMMHMITMYKWGTPPSSSTWMNEGLATYSGGTCSDYSLEEIYKYLIQSQKVMSMYDLAGNFYGSPDMITYTQSAFVSKFLIDKYGIEKFILLWKGGFGEIQSIYGFDSDALEVEMGKHVNKLHPSDIDFDWEKFNEGC